MKCPEREDTISVLVQSLRMSGAVPLLPLHVFMARTVAHFNFTCTLPCNNYCIIKKDVCSKLSSWNACWNLFQNHG